MNLFDLNNNNDILEMTLDGQDYQLKYPILYGQPYDNWLVSKCGKLWSIDKKKFIKGRINPQGYIIFEVYTKDDFWEDGGGRWKLCGASKITGTKGTWAFIRSIALHKIVIDTWKPLYDNPPKGIPWKEWKIMRTLPKCFESYSHSLHTDHIDDDKLNNHADNLQRKSARQNNSTVKAKENGTYVISSTRVREYTNTVNSNNAEELSHNIPSIPK